MSVKKWAILSRKTDSLLGIPSSDTTRLIGSLFGGRIRRRMALRSSLLHCMDVIFVLWYLNYTAKAHFSHWQLLWWYIGKGSILKEQRQWVSLIFHNGNSPYSITPSVSNMWSSSSVFIAWETFSRIAVLDISSRLNLWFPAAFLLIRISWILPTPGFCFAYSANPFAFPRLSLKSGLCGSRISTTYSSTRSFLTIIKSG